jgi:predicted O-linked N-acetylglucosamine transferase (SPINDLY family)
MAGRPPAGSFNPSAHRDWQRGVAHVKARDWALATKAFDRATRAAPGDGLYWVNLAHALRGAGEFAQAVDAARRALRLNAQDPTALRLLGDCCLQLHRYADAVQAFETLEAAGVAEPDAMLQHGSALQALGRPQDAAAALLRALSQDPTLVRGHALLADACRDQGLKREAVECMRTVLALEPDNLEALSHLSFEKRHLVDWTELDADLQTLTRLLQDLPEGRPCVTAAFSLLSLPLSSSLQLKAARCEAAVFTQGVQPLPAVRPADRRAAGPRIRLGLLSFDFREHPVSQLLVEVLEAFDRERFELHLYSAGPEDGSSLRQRMVDVADQFVELRGLSDAQAADRIRADGIDLLIDLMGHTRGHRMGILARRPAPVQAAYLGYPGSTGLPGVDYIVGDPLVTPIEHAGGYTECLAQLPLTMQPNGRNRPLPQPMTRAQAGLPQGAFVMCAFNHTYKIGPEAFDIWCSLLHELPQAVLWLKETNAQLHGNVLRAAADRGVAAQRIVFAPVVTYADHFSRLALADVFVDTWPYNAHTTASDALWAGVPVVTHCGPTYASRVAASVLNAAGLGALALRDPPSYRSAILSLAQDAQVLAGLKAHLTTHRLSLPLFDTNRYASELQALFSRMVQGWRADRPPEHLLAADPG